MIKKSYWQCFKILFGSVFHSFSIHFHTKATNLTACVHYGEIPAHNYSSKLYSKFTVRSVTLTAKKCGSCCVFGSLERHATVATFPWYSLCLLVLLSLHRAFYLPCNLQACNANGTDSWKISVAINNEECYHLRCDAVLSHRSFPAQWRHISRPSTLFLLWHHVVC
jgi:hypothetical protein